MVPKLLKANEVSTASQPNVSCLFLSLNLSLLMPRSLAAEELRAARRNNTHVKEKTNPNISEEFWLKATFYAGFQAFCIETHLGV